MKELQECLRIKRDIDKLNERIFELRSVVLSPKNQVITGMPRGGNNDNVMDRYLIKLEQLEREKDELLLSQQNNWKIAKKKGALTEQESYLLHQRFIEGLPWDKVAMKINKKYGNWTIGKCFRVYGRINKIL